MRLTNTHKHVNSHELHNIDSTEVSLCSHTERDGTRL